MEKRKIYKNIYMSFLQYSDGLLDLKQISQKLKISLRETKNL